MGRHECRKTLLRHGDKMLRRLCSDEKCPLPALCDELLPGLLLLPPPASLPLLLLSLLPLLLRTPSRLGPAEEFAVLPSLLRGAMMIFLRDAVQIIKRLVNNRLQPWEAILVLVDRECRIPTE